MKFLFVFSIQLLFLNGYGQVSDSIIIHNLESIKNCNEPFNPAIHPIQVDYFEALKRDLPIINLMNQFEVIDYKKYRKLIKRIHKTYRYQNDKHNKQTNFKLLVEQCKLSNGGFVSLYIKFYLDASKNILYKYFILEVGNQGNDSKYLKLLLNFINIKLHFDTCYSAQNGFGDKTLLLED
jgi:hypothetical protein